MALRLFSLQENAATADAERYFQLESCSTTRIQLLNNFEGCGHLLPVLLIMQADYGFSRMIETLIRDGSPADKQSEIDSFFQASQTLEESVLVWPYPIAIRGQHILLMKMWEFDVHDVDEEKSIAVQKSLCAILAEISSCWLAFDRSATFHCLDFIQSLYEEIKNRCGLSTQFIVFEAESISTSRILHKQLSTYKSKPYSNYTEFIALNDWQQQIYTLIAKTVDRQRPHHSGDMSFIRNWLAKVHLATRFASIDLSLHCFVEKFPLFDHSNFEIYEARIAQMERQHASLRHASAQPFLIRKGRNQYELDDFLLETIRSNFDPEKPTVVMVVLGGQGLGKSTFLNHLVQHCLKQNHSRQYFRMGNSTTHTTRESELLSCPLLLPNSDNQLMLIDLEGLGGMEMEDNEAAILQHNLVSSVLSVSSLPCIIVKNEANHQKVVESYVERLVSLSRTFGFRYERIHFLYQDKDFRIGEVTDNVHMQQWIDRLNHHHFARNQVIKLLNKPLFTDSDKAEMKERFLEQLLADSDFPKRNISGSHLPVRELLLQLRYITQHSTTDMGEIALGPADLAQISIIRTAKLQQLEALIQDIVSDGSVSLVSQFNEKARAFICELSEQPNLKRIRERLTIELKGYIQEFRLRLLRVESNFAAFRTWPEEEINSMISDRILEFYYDSVWVNSFLKLCDNLEGKLRIIGVHYPQQRDKIENAVAHLREKREDLKTWFFIHYGIQAVITVGSAGLGVAANGARAAITAARFGWSAVGAGVFSIGKLATFMSSKNLISPKAHALFVLKKTTEIVWVEEALRKFANDGEKCVVLVITRDGMDVARVLNQLAQEVTALAAHTVEQLSDQNERAQIVSFQYPSRRSEVILVLLRLSSAGRTREDEILELVATTLFPYVSVVCLFENEESEFSVNLFAAGVPQQDARLRLCLVLQKSLADAYKRRLQASILEMQLTPVTFQVETLATVESDIQLILREAMQDSPLISKPNAEDAIKRVQESVIGIGLV